VKPRRSINLAIAVGSDTAGENSLITSAQVARPSREEAGTGALADLAAFAFSAGGVCVLSILWVRSFQPVPSLLWRLLLCTSIAAAQENSLADVLKRAAALQQAGNYSAAIEVYQTFLRERPGSAEIRSQLGAALAHEGRFVEAAGEFSAALELNPSDNQARFQLGLIYYKSGDFLHAAEQFEKVRGQMAPDSDQGVRTSMFLADCYVRRGEDKKAIAVLDPLADSRPDDLAVSYLLGMALLHDNQEESAVHVLERIMSRSDTPEGRLLMAINKMRAVDLNGAREDILRCLELKPDWAEAHVTHGRILMMAADLSGAETAFRRALSCDPNSFEGLLELGALARQEGKPAEARDALTRALAIRPGDVPARYELALIESADGHDARAVQLLESVVRDAPNFMEAHVRLATLYFRLHRPEDGQREKLIADRLRAEKAEQGRSKGQGPR